MAELPQYDYMARHTLSLAVLDTASFATIAKKLKTEIGRYSGVKNGYENVVIALIMFSMLIQGLLGVLLLVSYRFEIHEDIHTAFSLGDWIIVAILCVILINNVIFAFDENEEVSIFRE